MGCAGAHWARREGSSLEGEPLKAERAVVGAWGCATLHLLVLFPDVKDPHYRAEFPDLVFLVVRSCLPG